LQGPSNSPPTLHCLHHLLPHSHLHPHPHPQKAQTLKQQVKFYIESGHIIRLKCSFPVVYYQFISQTNITKTFRGKRINLKLAYTGVNKTRKSHALMELMT
jgi:hypothetical protein